MLDLHLHVWPHRPGTRTPTVEYLEQYCDQAESTGITQIAITEHSHRFGRILDDVMRFWKRPMSGPVADATTHVLSVEGRADLDAHVSVLLDAKDAGLPILLGLEVDYLPGAMSAMSKVLDDYPFDVLALLDVIKVAGHSAPQLVEHERRLVEGLTSADVVIEFSSAGLRQPVADTYPSAPLLDALLAAGVTLTTASDGHTIERVGAGFDHLANELDARGISELATFDRRQRVAYRR